MVQKWLSSSASSALPLVNSPESPDTKREECAHSDAKKTGNKEETSTEVLMTHNRSQTSFSDVEDRKTEADATTQRHTILYPRQIQNLRDSFTDFSKMSTEDREEVREMAREWGHHDPEIRERFEQVLGEQEALDALGGGLALGDVEDRMFY